MECYAAENRHELLIYTTRWISETCRMREGRNKGVHTTMLFHLYEILEQVKLICSDPKQRSGWLGPEEGQGWLQIFWSNILIVMVGMFWWLTKLIYLRLVLLFYINVAFRRRLKMFLKCHLWTAQYKVKYFIRSFCNMPGLNINIAHILFS